MATMFELFSTTLMHLFLSSALRGGGEGRLGAPRPPGCLSLWPRSGGEQRPVQQLHTEQQLPQSPSSESLIHSPKNQAEDFETKALAKNIHPTFPLVSVDFINNECLADFSG